MATRSLTRKEIAKFSRPMVEALYREIFVDTKYYWKSKEDLVERLANAADVRVVATLRPKMTPDGEERA